jgi:hypothetical protein
VAATWEGGRGVGSQPTALWNQVLGQVLTRYSLDDVSEACCQGCGWMGCACGTSVGDCGELSRVNLPRQTSDFLTSAPPSTFISTGKRISQTPYLAHVTETTGRYGCCGILEITHHS